MHSMTEFLGITKGVFTGLWDFFNLKFVPSFAIPLFGMLFGFGDHMVLKALFALVIIDFITGIASAFMTKEPITSKGVVRTAFKIAVYGLLISAAHLTQRIIPFDIFIEEAVTTFLALTELISILENAGKMGFAIPKKLLNQLHKIRDEETTISSTKTIKVEERPDVVVTHTVEQNLVETHTKETKP